MKRRSTLSALSTAAACLLLASIVASNSALAFVIPKHHNSAGKNLMLPRSPLDLDPLSATREPPMLIARRRSFQLFDWQEHVSLPRGTRGFVASLCFATALLVSPLKAQAGFGPSGGATTSLTPGLTSVNVNDLSGKKLQQLIDNTIDENRLNEFQEQLDSLIESIFQAEKGDAEEKEGFMQQSPVQNTEEAQRLEKARSFQDQFMIRERLLDKLDAQPWWFNYLAAFCGSVVSTLAMHPVDTIKTRLQVHSSNATEEERGTFSNLYEGLTGNIWKEGPPSALYLGVYETVKASLLHGKLAAVWAGFLGLASSGVTKVAAAANPTYLLITYLTAGAAGELVGSTVRSPAEAIKSMVQTKSASTTGEAVELVLARAEGRRNVVRAWSASLWRDVPFGAIQLAIFELTKAFILNSPNIDFDSSSLQSEAIIGAFAGACGAFVTTPSDVLTTRIITQTVREEGDEPLGVLAMGRLVYDEGGLRAFFTGWEARVLYWAPAISLFLTCCCSVRQLGVKLDLFA